MLVVFLASAVVKLRVENCGLIWILQIFLPNFTVSFYGALTLYIHIHYCSIVIMVRGFGKEFRIFHVFLFLFGVSYLAWFDISSFAVCVVEFFHSYLREIFSCTDQIRQTSKNLLEH